MNDTSTVLEINENDIGNFIPDDKKFELLSNPWMPSKYYNFKKDINDSKRPFLFKWFAQFPWLVYLKVLRGALCLHLFFFFLLI